VQGKAWGSVFVRENVAQFDLELVHHGFELAEGEVMFAPFKPMQRCVGDAGFLAKLGIRQFTPRFSQVFGQLDIQALSHPGTVANHP